MKPTAAAARNRVAPLRLGDLTVAQVGALTVSGPGMAQDIRRAAGAVPAEHLASSGTPG